MSARGGVQVGETWSTTRIAHVTGEGDDEHTLAVVELWRLEERKVTRLPKVGE